MGYFTEGYNIATQLQQNKIQPEDYNNQVKEMLKISKYNDCIEWYNGFYKGMLDYDLFMLEQSFTALKKEAENNGK